MRGEKWKSGWIPVAAKNVASSGLAMIQRPPALPVARSEGTRRSTVAGFPAPQPKKVSRVFATKVCAPASIRIWTYWRFGLPATPDMTSSACGHRWSLRKQAKGPPIDRAVDGPLVTESKPACHRVLLRGALDARGALLHWYVCLPVEFTRETHRTHLLSLSARSMYHYRDLGGTRQAASVHHASSGHHRTSCPRRSLDQDRCEAGSSQTRRKRAVIRCRF